jgi:histidinol phosphatase-like PHP family hydrolase
MIDFHTHTLLSDGALVPSELARRARVAGYRAIAMTDHVDQSNMKGVLESIIRFTGEFNALSEMRVTPGVELTHIPPGLIARLTGEARALGARIVICHGETLAEPVMPGTNRAAILAGVDILAHPGLISEEDARLAAERAVHLEITSRKGHSISNGHVARIAQKTGARLIIDSDAHAPGDLIAKKTAEEVLLGAGLDAEGVAQVWKNAEALLAKISS